MRIKKLLERWAKVNEEQDFNNDKFLLRDGDRLEGTEINRDFAKVRLYVKSLGAGEFGIFYQGETGTHYPLATLKKPHTTVGDAKKALELNKIAQKVYLKNESFPAPRIMQVDDPIFKQAGITEGVSPRVEKVKVTWFDDVNGIGGGETSTGQEVFLKWQNIEKNGKFLTLKTNEIVVCEISPIKGKLYATKIIRKL